EEGHLTEQVALAKLSPCALAPIESLPDLDGTGVHQVGLTVGVVTFLEDDLRGPVPPALHVSKGESLIDLQLDPAQLPLRLHRDSGVRPAPESALEDARPPV